MPATIASLAEGDAPPACVARSISLPKKPPPRPVSDAALAARLRCASIALLIVDSIALLYFALLSGFQDSFSMAADKASLLAPAIRSFDFPVRYEEPIPAAPSPNAVFSN